jgi:thiosulfate/3-mercaptopyruvate sulfurtransferase
VGDPLISVAALAAAQAAGDRLRLVDTRWRLGQPAEGRRLYEAGHIPGAAFLGIDTDLAGPPGPGPGRHPLPTAAAFERAMRAAGVDGDTAVVAYDDAGGAHAARLWFLLRYFGHDRVRVLDGGLPAWAAAGYPLRAGGETIPPSAGFAARPRADWIVDAKQVDRLRGAASTLLLDARAPERFRGEVEPIDRRAGHIPGARNAPFADNLADGVFLPPEALRSRYQALGVEPSRDVIVYCGSGVTACHDLLALARIGQAARLYEGSWSDWAANPELPIETGSRDTRGTAR